MNILWIEDSQKTSRNQIEKSCFLDSKLFKESFNTIDIPDSLDDVLQKVENVDYLYDYFVIDIDLSEFLIGEAGNKIKNKIDPQMDEKTFLQRAGHNVYLKLLEKGINTERVVFLTGNAQGNSIRKWYRQLKKAIIEKDETLYKTAFNNLTPEPLLADFKDEFTSHIKNQKYDESDEIINMIADQYDEGSGNIFGELKKFSKQARFANYPEAFVKSDPEDFHNWLQASLTPHNNEYNYIILRRGIIEGCNFLIQSLENNKKDEDYILFNQTVRANTNSQLFNKYLSEYLNKIKKLLPMMPAEDNRMIYYSLIKELSTEWERSAGFILKGQSKEPWVNNYQDTCHRQMKLIRNWTSHDLLTNELDEKFIGFIFITAMRALFNLDSNSIYEYENYLFQLFKQTSNKPYQKIKTDLAKSYFNLRNVKQFRYKNPDNIRFSTMVMNYGKDVKSLTEKDTVKKTSISLIYQMFWHGIFPCVNKIPSRKHIIDSVPSYIHFIIDEEPPKDSFPYKLAQMIRQDSFSK